MSGKMKDNGEDFRAAYERERDLRRAIERRFDHRITDERIVEIVRKAERWTGVAPIEGNPSKECQSAIVDLLILCNTLDAERRRLQGDK